MTRQDAEGLARSDGFRPFVIVTKGGLRMEVPHSEFIDIPPGEETSYITVYTTGRAHIARFIDLDAIDHIDWEVRKE